MFGAIVGLINQLPVWHRYAIGLLTVFIILVLVLPAERVNASRNAPPVELIPNVSYSLPISLVESTEPLVLEPEWSVHKIQFGDSLARILANENISPVTTHYLSRIKQDGVSLTSLKVGQEIALKKNTNGELSELQYRISATERLIVRQIDTNQFSAEKQVADVTTSLNFAQGTIQANFWNTAVEAGMTNNQIMELAGIFGWDIDFATEIRRGDRFNIVYEERFINGEYVGRGKILAAEFINQKETFTAILFNDGNYYTPEGRSMRKSFLRAPVNFRYISSNFTPKRFHPVQKRWKAHRGVDYAAPTGTPVVAAGDGRVIKAGYDRFNGHHVFIKHPGGYVTKYIHFSKRKANKGQQVKQGQVIGLVGSTGLASGPHLHYEFLVNGVHRNPRTVDLPKAEPIDQSKKAEFLEVASQRLQWLARNERIMLASL